MPLYEGEKCLGALALSQTKHTGLFNYGLVNCLAQYSVLLTVKINADAKPIHGLYSYSKESLCHARRSCSHGYCINAGPIPGNPKW